MEGIVMFKEGLRLLRFEEDLGGFEFEKEV